jgi:hypothetical protein
MTMERLLQTSALPLGGLKETVGKIHKERLALAADPFFLNNLIRR